MEKTTVLITGCSSGIGLGLAARLAADTARRFKVYATMRDLAKGERLLERLGGCCPDTLEVLQLDVTDPCSLAAAAQRVQGQRLDVLGTALPGAPTIPRVAGGTSLGLPALPRALGADAKSWEVPAVLGLGWDVFSRAGVQELGLGVPRVTGPSIGKDPHVLVFWHLDGARECEGGSGASSPALCPAVCNAGVGLMGPLETCSDQAMKTIFDVNLFGAIRTIQAFLPAMKRRRAGRIIVSSSIGGLQGLPFNSVYCASKFAVEGLCESLAIVLRPFNIHLTLVECGPVNTSFLANLQRPDPEGSELQGLDAETRGLYHRYLRHCQSLFHDAAQEVEEVLQVFVEAIGTPCPPLRCVTTQLFAPLSRLRLASPDGSAYVRAMHDFVFGRGEAGGDQP
ncbi:17-beta-hydroxysteroid dehydrogenase type 1 isoform X1 [Harpia harpyja]|uniref:17-beta-hydroxysteroid dehydrogenase type 1 isoform X1 n=1 Tax=Harpia harpyja TaxID=202280 RepID=UPI0022B14F81|nr:17-beta-hydroxysteroid dehydrogenase type 1 isoform X1 [Harpia harpyja]